MIRCLRRWLVFWPFWSDIASRVAKTAQRALATISAVGTGTTREFGLFWVSEHDAANKDFADVTLSDLDSFTPHASLFVRHQIGPSLA